MLVWVFKKESSEKRAMREKKIHIPSFLTLHHAPQELDLFHHIIHLPTRPLEFEVRAFKYFGNNLFIHPAG